MIRTSYTISPTILRPRRRRHATGGLRPLVRGAQRYLTSQAPRSGREVILESPGAHVVSRRTVGGMRTAEEALALAERLDRECVHGRRYADDL